MSRRRKETLESYEGIPLDSPQRRTIQNRNAQRVYRAKRIKRTCIGTPPYGQAPVQPDEAQRIGNTAVSIVASPSPPPTLPESLTRYDHGTTTYGPFSPPKCFDRADDDLIGRILADGPICSALDASFTDMPHDMASISLGESGLVDAPVQFIPGLPDSDEPSQHPSPSATTDLTSSWAVADFSPDFHLPYRPGEIASSTLPPLDCPPPLPSAPITGPVPQPLIPPNPAPTLALPRPTPPCQTCAPATTTTSTTSPPSSAFRAEDLLRGSIWRHPIHTAAHNGHARILRLLLQAGCDINLKDSTGGTPLHASAAEGHAEAVRLLLSHGCDIDALDHLGWTPVHLATRNGHTDCVELLLKLGL